MNELESVGIEERKTADVSFWNIDQEVAQSVREIMRNYSGRSGQIALKEMVFRYHVFDLLAAMNARLENVENAVYPAEVVKKEIKTFGGNKVEV